MSRPVPSTRTPEAPVTRHVCPECGHRRRTRAGRLIVGGKHVSASGEHRWHDPAGAIHQGCPECGTWKGTCRTPDPMPDWERADGEPQRRSCHSCPGGSYSGHDGPRFDFDDPAWDAVPIEEPPADEHRCSCYRGVAAGETTCLTCRLTPAIGAAALQVLRTAGGRMDARAFRDAIGERVPECPRDPSIVGDVRVSEDRVMGEALTRFNYDGNRGGDRYWTSGDYVDDDQGRTWTVALLPAGAKRADKEALTADSLFAVAPVEPEAEELDWDDDGDDLAYLDEDDDQADDGEACALTFDDAPEPEPLEDPAAAAAATDHTPCGCGHGRSTHSADGRFCLAFPGPEARDTCPCEGFTEAPAPVTVAAVALPDDELQRALHAAYQESRGRETDETRALVAECDRRNDERGCHQDGRVPDGGRGERMAAAKRAAAALAAARVAPPAPDAPEGWTCTRCAPDHWEPCPHAFTCPVCQAGPGVACRRPSGHRPAEGTHASRVALARAHWTPEQHAEEAAWEAEHAEAAATPADPAPAPVAAAHEALSLF